VTSLTLKLRDPTLIIEHSWHGNSPVIKTVINVFRSGEIIRQEGAKPKRYDRIFNSYKTRYKIHQACIPGVRIEYLKLKMRILNKHVGQFNCAD